MFLDTSTSLRRPFAEASSESLKSVGGQWRLRLDCLFSCRAINSLLPSKLARPARWSFGRANFRRREEISSGDTRETGGLRDAPAARVNQAAGRVCVSGSALTSSPPLPRRSPLVCGPQGPRGPARCKAVFPFTAPREASPARRFTCERARASRLNRAANYLAARLASLVAPPLTRPGYSRDRRLSTRKIDCSARRGLGRTSGSFQECRSKSVDVRLDLEIAIPVCAVDGLRECDGEYEITVARDRCENVNTISCLRRTRTHVEIEAIIREISARYRGRREIERRYHGVFRTEGEGGGSAATGQHGSHEWREDPSSRQR